MVENGHFVHQPKQKVEMVLDEQDRHSFRSEFTQQIGELFQLHFRQSGGGLVKDEQTRLEAEAAGNLGDTLLSVGQVFDLLISPFCQMGLLDQLIRGAQNSGFLRGGPSCAQQA